jgi:hypothetical protein
MSNPKTFMGRMAPPPPPPIQRLPPIDPVDIFYDEKLDSGARVIGYKDRIRLIKINGENVDMTIESYENYLNKVKAAHSLQENHGKEATNLLQV